MTVLACVSGVEWVRLGGRAAAALGARYVIREQADRAVLLATSSRRLAQDQFRHEVFVRQLGHGRTEVSA